MKAYDEKLAAAAELAEQKAKEAEELTRAAAAAAAKKEQDMIEAAVHKRIEHHSEEARASAAKKKRKATRRNEDEDEEEAEGPTDIDVDDALETADQDERVMKTIYTTNPICELLLGRNETDELLDELRAVYSETRRCTKARAVTLTEAALCDVDTRSLFSSALEVLFGEFRPELFEAALGRFDRAPSTKEKPAADLFAVLNDKNVSFESDAVKQHASWLGKMPAGVKRLEPLALSLLFGAQMALKTKLDPATNTLKVAVANKINGGAAHAAVWARFAEGKAPAKIRDPLNSQSWLQNTTRFVRTPNLTYDILVTPPKDKEPAVAAEAAAAATTEPNGYATLIDVDPQPTKATGKRKSRGGGGGGGKSKTTDAEATMADQARELSNAKDKAHELEKRLKAATEAADRAKAAASIPAVDVGALLGGGGAAEKNGRASAAQHHIERLARMSGNDFAVEAESEAAFKWDVTPIVRRYSTTLTLVPNRTFVRLLSAHRAALNHPASVMHYCTANALRLERPNNAADSESIIRNPWFAALISASHRTPSEEMRITASESDPSTILSYGDCILKTVGNYVKEYIGGDPAAKTNQRIAKEGFEMGVAHILFGFLRPSRALHGVLDGDAVLPAARIVRAGKERAEPVILNVNELPVGTQFCCMPVHVAIIEQLWKHYAEFIQFNAAKHTMEDFARLRAAAVPRMSQASSALVAHDSGSDLGIEVKTYYYRNMVPFIAALFPPQLLAAVDPIFN